MPELTDEEFFAILGVAPGLENLEGHLAVSREVADLPTLVNSDGTRYTARKTAVESHRAVSREK